MINVLIIEDEIPAQVNLKKLIDKCCPDSQIVMTLTSVRQSVKWLEENPEGADVIFMDVELSDGICFEIFERVNITQHVIITTAYDNYAINAFRAGSIDYLLKPIAEEEMRRAWSRCVERLNSRTTPEIERLMDMVTRASSNINREYRKRFTVKTGEKIVIIPVEEIAYCYSKDKSTYTVNRNGTAPIGLFARHGTGDARPKDLLPYITKLHNLDKLYREHFEISGHTTEAATYATYRRRGGGKSQSHV